MYIMCTAGIKVLFTKQLMKNFKKAITILMLVSFVSSLIVSPAGAASAGGLVTPSLITSSVAGFQPPVLLGLKVHPENPLLFDFIVDQGQAKLSQDDLKAETEKLVKYFLAALTIPDKEVWVNLSPTEKDRIIPDVLGQTVMGKTMLEQDYLLKQLASSLTNPETDLGQQYWQKAGTAPTLSKVWIVPEKAEVLESSGIVLVGEKRLKVKMEEEAQGAAVFQTMILPAINKKVNESKDFADVRQIYNSVILATWYKQALKESLLGKVYADKGKVAGVETDDKEMKQRIYEQYLEAFKKGAYNLIKEETDSATGEMIPRKYFSGGLTIVPEISVRNVSSSVVQGQIRQASSALIVTVVGEERQPAELASSRAASPVAARTVFTSLGQTFAQVLEENEFATQEIAKGVQDKLRWFISPDPSIGKPGLEEFSQIARQAQEEYSRMGYAEFSRQLYGFIAADTGILKIPYFVNLKEKVGEEGDWAQVFFDYLSADQVFNKIEDKLNYVTGEARNVRPEAYGELIKTVSPEIKNLLANKIKLRAWMSEAFGRSGVSEDVIDQIAASSAIFTLSPKVTEKLTELKTGQLPYGVANHLTDDVVRDILAAIHTTFTYAKWTAKYNDVLPVQYDPRPGSSYPLQQARELIAQEMFGMRKEGSLLYFKVGKEYSSYADFLSKLEENGYLRPSLGGVQESLAKAESVPLGEVIPVADATTIIRQFRIAKTPVPLSALLTFAKHVGRLQIEDGRQKYSLETLRAAEKMLKEQLVAFKNLVDTKDKGTEERAFYQRLETQMNFALKRLTAIIVVRYNEDGERELTGNEARLKVALEWANSVGDEEFISVEAAELIMQNLDSPDVAEVPRSVFATIIEAADRNPSLYQSERLRILQTAQRRLSVIEEEDAAVNVAGRAVQQAQARAEAAEREQRQQEIDARFQREVDQADVLTDKAEVRIAAKIKAWKSTTELSPGVEQLITKRELVLLLALMKKAAGEKDILRYDPRNDIDSYDEADPAKLNLLKARQFIANQVFGMLIGDGGIIEYKLTPQKSATYKEFIGQLQTLYQIVKPDARIPTPVSESTEKVLLRLSDVSVSDPKGIHLRPSAQLLRIATKNANEFEIYLTTAEGVRFNIDNIFTVLSRKVSTGTRLNIEIVLKDGITVSPQIMQKAEAALKEIRSVFETQYADPSDTVASSGLIVFSADAIAFLTSIGTREAFKIIFPAVYTYYSDRSSDPIVFQLAAKTSLGMDFVAKEGDIQFVRELVGDRSQQQGLLKNDVVLKYLKIVPSLLRNKNTGEDFEGYAFVKDDGQIGSYADWMQALIKDDIIISASSSLTERLDKITKKSALLGDLVDQKILYSFFARYLEQLITSTTLRQELDALYDLRRDVQFGFAQDDLPVNSDYELFDTKLMLAVAGVKANERFKVINEDVPRTLIFLTILRSDQKEYIQALKELRAAVTEKRSVPSGTDQAILRTLKLIDNDGSVPESIRKFVEEFRWSGNIGNAYADQETAARVSYDQAMDATVTRILSRLKVPAELQTIELVRVAVESIITQVIIESINMKDDAGWAKKAALPDGSTGFVLKDKFTEDNILMWHYLGPDLKRAFGAMGMTLQKGDVLGLSEAFVNTVDQEVSRLAASSGVVKAKIAPLTPVGGIDFDPTNMNLQIKRNGKGVPLPLPQQNLQQINIEGLFPVIINIVPVNAQTLPIFLGAVPQEPAREPELAASTAS